MDGTNSTPKQEAAAPRNKLPFGAIPLQTSWNIADGQRIEPVSKGPEREMVKIHSDRRRSRKPRYLPLATSPVEPPVNPIQTSPGKPRMNLWRKGIEPNLAAAAAGIRRRKIQVKLVSSSSESSSASSVASGSED